MKLQKFKTDNATGALGTATGVIVGAMLSSGVSGVIPMNNKTAVKAIVGVTGLALATFVGGTDTAAKAIRTIGAGMAAQQGKEMISDAVKPHLPAATGKGSQFLHDALGSPEQFKMASALGARVRRVRKKLGNPDFQMAQAIPQGGFAAI